LIVANVTVVNTC